MYRTKVFIAVLILGYVSLSGCMTFASQVAHFTDNDMGHLCSPDCVIYGGVYRDVRAIQLSYNAVMEGSGVGLLFGSLCVIDLPMSLAADTVILPLTIGEHIAILSREE